MKGSSVRVRASASRDLQLLWTLERRQSQLVVAASRTPRAHEAFGALVGWLFEPALGLRLGGTPGRARTGDRLLDRHAPPSRRVAKDVAVNAGGEAGVGVAHVLGNFGHGSALVDQ